MTNGRVAAAVLVVVAVLAGTVVPVGARTRAPDRWDPRVLPYVRVVERARGLRFEHPVTVRFLTAKSFRKELRSGDDDVTDDDRRAARVDAARLHALGLAPADLDLIAAVGADEDETVAGYYDQDEKEMVVRGKTLRSTDVRATIVHELTHALQDQRFDLSHLDDAAAGSASKALAELTLVEGDAVWVEGEYVSSLPQREQDRYYGDDGGPGTGDGSSEPPAGVPATVDAELSAPYVVGPAFVDLLVQRGKGARNRAFRALPASDEQVLDPVAFADHDRIGRVGTPKLEAGEQRRGKPGQLGAYGLYMLLATRLEPRRALVAATGWKGDRFAGFTRDGRDCVRQVVATDSDDDARELETALGAWTQQLPAGAALVARTAPNRVELSACADDATAMPVADVVNGALDVLGERLYFYRDLGGLGLSPRERRCVGDQLATDPEIVELSYRDDFGDAEERTVRQRTAQYATACGAGL